MAAAYPIAVRMSLPSSITLQAPFMLSEAALSCTCNISHIKPNTEDSISSGSLLSARSSRKDPGMEVDPGIGGCREQPMSDSRVLKGNV